MSSNVLVVTYWNYEDPLIQTYTLPYIRIIQRKLPPGSRVLLVTLERESVDGGGRGSESISAALSAEGIDWRYGIYRPFGLKGIAMWSGLMARLFLDIHRLKVKRIHCMGTPSGTIGYLLSVLTGRPLVIDSYEPHAESMVENGTWSRTSLAFRVLFALEKRQTRRADYLIAANAGMRIYAKEKLGVELKHMLVKPACVDLSLFALDKLKDPDLLRELGLTDKIVCVYAGKFGGIYLDKEVFSFLREGQLHWGNRFRVLLLTNHREEEIRNYCLEAGLDPSIVVMRFIPHREIPRYIGLGDFALTPVKPVPTKKYCTPVKDGEYWAMGLPVVITNNISDDSDIIKRHDIGAVLESFDRESLRNAVLKIDSLLKEGPHLTARIRKIAEEYRNFELAEKAYQEVYGQNTHRVLT